MAEPDTPSTASNLPTPSISAVSPLPTIPSAAFAAAAPPPPPAPTGLLTRAAKGKARAQETEAPSPVPFTPSAGASTAPYSLRGKKRSAPIVESSSDSDEINEMSDSSDDDAPRKAMEMPPGVSIPRVHVEVASPTHPDRPPPPRSTGEVRTLAYYDNDLRMTLLAGTVWPLQERWQKDMQGDIWEDWTSSDRLQVLHQTQEDPVSYTHLDVYKRQLCFLPLRE